MAPSTTLCCRNAAIKRKVITMTILKFFNATRHHLTGASSPGALFDVDATVKMLKLQ